MTTENPIDAGQAEMDAAQNGAVSSAPAVTEQLQALQSENATLRSEVRGLQGRIDKGLSEISSALEQRRQQEELESLPEEVREYMAPVLGQVAELKSQITQMSQSASPTGTTGNAELDQFLGGMGLNANSPGLNLEAYNSGDMDTFLASARQAVLNAAVSQQAPAPNPPPTPGQSPPIDGVPSASIGGTTEEEIQMAYISNQIDYPTYIQRMQARGFQY